MLYSVLISLLAFIFAIAILVGVHEYGHFIVARLCGVKVLEFSLGFGRAIWKRKDKKGTQYQLAIIPLGGYVKMLDEREGPIPITEQAYAFNRQPIWKRSLIILAGPCFNLLLAFIAYWLIFMIGFSQLAPKLGDITPNSIAAKAGLQHGQVIVQIDNQKIYSWPDAQTSFLEHVGQNTK
ncbi:MAG: RIP metalloprotease RseP, partial [Gammaproteobacteria bacterium]